MEDDKRMYFIRNMEALQNEPGETEVTEYEVIADSRVIGELTYGPYYLVIWEFSSKRQGEDRKLCLRIKEKLPESDNPSLKLAKKSGFYHGGGITDELVALSSLFLRRRLKLGSMVRRNDQPTMIDFKSLTTEIDKPLLLGESNIEVLSKWIKLVEGLIPKYHLRYILAVKFYHRALLLIEDEPDLAYLNLISAIEILCQETDIGQIGLNDLDTNLSELVESVNDEAIRNALKRAILKRERFIKRRFTEFILQHIEKEFWTEGIRPEHGQIKPDDLSGILNTIYDQRSRTLHNGEPFPVSIFYPPLLDAEIDFSLGMSSGEKKWEPKDFIPYPHFFERLVNHVLKTFLRRNQVS